MAHQPTQFNGGASLDGRAFTPLGAVFAAREARWVGAKLGLFTAGAAGASADFDWFRVGPPNR